MKKIYIAGKIGGLLVEEYTRLFEIGKNELIANGYEPISPLDFPHNHDKSWASYMKEDLTEMLKCDGVYCLHNWRDSPGAKVEINLAMQLGLDIYFQKYKTISVPIDTDNKFC